MLQYPLQVDGVKFSFGLSSIACIGLLLCLRLPDIFGLILLFAFLFGFFGVSSYPLFLELAVEDAYPLDPVISEVEIHCQQDHNSVQGDDAPAWPDLQLCGDPPWQQSLLAGFVSDQLTATLFVAMFISILLLLFSRWKRDEFTLARTKSLHLTTPRSSISSWRRPPSSQYSCPYC